jgi:hypothetical protein
MYKLNKIRGHIKMLELQELKLTRYLAEENSREVVNPSRVQDITRALKRVTENINMWREKISAFEVAPPRPPERPPIISGPDVPWIG